MTPTLSTDRADCLRAARWATSYTSICIMVGYTSRRCELSDATLDLCAELHRRTDEYTREIGRLERGEG